MILTRNKIPIIILISVLFGCATPEPMMISPGVFMVSRTSAAGSVFANMAQLKADTIEAANRFAHSKGKDAVAVSIRDERPVPGFPLVEYQFRLVDRGSVGDSSVILKKDASYVPKIFLFEIPIKFVMKKSLCSTTPIIVTNRWVISSLISHLCPKKFSAVINYSKPLFLKGIICHLMINGFKSTIDVCS
jgi:hypothetical protein